MSSNERKSLLLRPLWQPARVAAAAAAIAVSGCSADITRFDSPAFGLTEGGVSSSAPSESVGRQAASTPVVGESAGGNGGAYYPPPSGRGQPSTRMSALGDPAPAPLPPSPPSKPVATPVAPASKAPAYVPASAPATSAPAAKGDAIEVQARDTLYGLSLRHHVSVAELMSTNDLKSPNLKPGQILYLPAGHSAGKKPLRKPEIVALSPSGQVAPTTAPSARPAAPAAAQAAAPAPTDWNGSYTVKAGDSPYNIARQHKVTVADLQRVNGITDPTRIRPGVVLKVPGSGGAVASTQAAAPVAPQPAGEAPRVVQTKPVIVNGERTHVAAATPETATDATAPAKGTEIAAAGGQAATAAGTASAVPAGKFRWPVKGRIIAGFGPRPDGSLNDGINLAVPLGTEVHAAEAGVVAYAGSELKGYGNLILVRHDNGWVTAYAHNDEMLVKRGDKVKRGQTIGKAGKTGTVDQPQVHFELRQGSKPIDPTPHMEKT